MKIGKNANQILNMCIGIETEVQVSRSLRAHSAISETQVIDLCPAYEVKAIANTEKSGGALN